MWISDRLIYWGLFACTANYARTIDHQLQGKSITLIRNQARISIFNPSDNGFLEVTGFVVYNTNAYGTVAPYRSDAGFEWPGDEEFVTLPGNRAKVSDIMDVDTSSDQYVFETKTGRTTR